MLVNTLTFFYKMNPFFIACVSRGCNHTLQWSTFWVLLLPLKANIHIMKSCEIHQMWRASALSSLSILITVYVTNGTSADDMESDNPPKRPASSTTQTKTQTPHKYKKQKKFDLLKLVRQNVNLIDSGRKRGSTCKL